MVLLASASFGGEEQLVETTSSSGWHRIGRAFRIVQARREALARVREPLNDLPSCPTALHGAVQFSMRLTCEVVWCSTAGRFRVEPASEYF